MPLPCPQCKNRTVEIKQYEFRKMDTDQQGCIELQKVIEAQCQSCAWVYREVDNVSEPELLALSY